MRHAALIAAFYLTSTLAACAQPGPDGPQAGYGQNGAPPAYAQQGWAGGMQSAPDQTRGPDSVPPQTPPSVSGGKERGGMAAKFRRANSTGDGRLTQGQAQAAGMAGVAKHFTQIDRDQKGYVTLEDVRAWHQAKHAKKMAKRSAQGQPAGAPAGGNPPPAQDGQQY